MDHPVKYELASEDAIHHIIEAARARPIVPLLGAGISIAAGFPTIRFVVQYLAKVDFAIRLGVFEHRFPRLSDRQQAVDLYRQHPSRFLEDFGWPDLGQLEADLWMWLGRGQSDEYKQHGGEGRYKIWQYGQKWPRNTPYDYDLEQLSLSHDLLTADILTDPEGVQGTPGSGRLDMRDHLLAIVQWTLRQDIAARDPGSAVATLREWRRWKKWYHDGFYEKEPSLLLGEWEALLDRLCEGSFDLTDMLFTSFELGRSPTVSHRYLAFLQRKLGIPMILTTNFDSLLELALYQEGTLPKVFDVHRDADLPDAALVHRQFSVLKLHGSAYGLRLGERLRYPLDAEERHEALRYIPPDALVVVMGFSGSERRIMQLLQAIARENDIPEQSPRLLWIQGPSAVSPLCRELVNDSSGYARITYTTNIDLFMQELYFTFAGSYQSSATGYAALSGRPHAKHLRFPPLVPQVGPSAADDASHGISPPQTRSESGAASERAARIVERARKRRPVHVFLRDPNAASSTSWASVAAAAFVASLDYGYNTIWIDLENHHTVQGVVAEFFDKVHVFDPQAPTCALTDFGMAPEKAIGKAVERIREVFQRGRYILVLDSVESFGRAQLMHHGMPTYHLYSLAEANHAGDYFLRTKDRLEKEFERRVKALSMFIRALLNLRVESCRSFDIEQDYCNSYILISVDFPRLRYQGGGTTPKTSAIVFEELISPLRDAEQRPHIIVHRQDQSSYRDFNILASPNPAATLPEGWRRPEASDQSQEMRSQERIGDTLVLLKELRAASENRESFSASATAAFLGLLSVFRRPRTLPMIRSIVERWGLRLIGEAKALGTTRSVRRAVDSLIKHELINPAGRLGVVAQWYEGGVLWIFREVHEAAYDSLTEQLHVTDWIESWRNDGFAAMPPRSSRAAALLDGLVMVTWHLSAARTYYADVFLPTRDVSAFYEYLYHRVAAARIITFLLALIHTGNRALWADACAYVDQILEDRQLAQDWAYLGGPSLSVFTNVFGVFTPLGGLQRIADWNMLLQSLQALRAHALETLLMALKRNEGFLRSVATPDTVLALSQQFLDRQLDELRGSIFDICLGDTINRAEVEALKAAIAPNDYKSGCLDELERLFEGLQFRARISKLDFEGAFVSAVWESDRSRSTVGLPSSHTDMRRILKSAESELIKNEKRACGIHPLPEDWKKSCEKMIRIARCSLHLQEEDGGRHVATCVERVIRSCKRIENKAAGSDGLSRWAKKARRGALEVLCKARQSRWLLWEPLVERKGCLEDCPDLRRAEEESVAYEDILRETSETYEDDARHRSSALSLRARSLYLRGHFQQAHHNLDLASSGLLPDRVDHRTSLAVVHLYRAELLAMSADSHYRKECEQLHRAEQLALSSSGDFSSGGDRAMGSGSHTLRSDGAIRSISRTLLREVASAQKKIGRAEVELKHADAILRSMTHQNIWRIRLDFGCAQMSLEKLLWEFEELFWNCRSLRSHDYLRRSGRLEQIVLDGMRRLRSVLDLLPFREEAWNSVDEIRKSAPLVRCERLVYTLWRQFFVVGACYSAVLKNQHHPAPVTRHPGSDEHVQIYDQLRSVSRQAIYGDDAERYRKRWQLWCDAMRFGQFAQDQELAKSLIGDVALRHIARPDALLTPRTVIVDFMHQACNEQKINVMWNIRRKLGESVPQVSERRMNVPPVGQRAAQSAGAS